MRRTILLSVSALALLAAPLAAQKKPAPKVAPKPAAARPVVQQVIPPKAVY